MTVIIQFFSDKDMNQKWLKGLIRTCKKQWKGRPQHFLEFQKQQLSKNKKEYDVKVERLKKEFESIIDKYKYLIPIFSLLNQDVFI